ncbi:unnamed protein product [Symbiodinium necroappetens]|uniref:Uncharacterized protein n=1 Tax=Symbiodinium necroappetens TaxID=1628268 RepID=A0A812XEE3_9DINO|nr:unnamed protein product [Symbiodinium necroappetens]
MPIRISAASPATAAVPVQGSHSMSSCGYAVYAPGPVQAPSIAVSAPPAAKVITISATAEAQQAAETVTAGPGDHAFVTNQLQRKDAADGTESCLAELNLFVSWTSGCS